MELDIKTFGDVSVVRVPGEFLDASNHEEFMRDITPVLVKTPKVVLDIGGLRTVDSSGLGAFAYCLRKTRDAGGGLRICCVSESIQAAFELVHIERIIGVHETPEQAVAAFAG